MMKASEDDGDYEKTKSPIRKSQPPPPAWMAREANVRRRKPRRTRGMHPAYHEPTLREKLAGLAVLFFSCVYLLFLWRTQSLLEKMEETNSFPWGHDRRTDAEKYIDMEIFNHVPSAQKRSHSNRFFVFHGNIGGQGEGNTMAGLLAAHMLGYEFDRTVCVTRRWRHFHVAFEPIHPDVIAGCPQVLDDLEKAPYQRPIVSILSYDKAPDECYLQELFSSNKPVVGLSINTYPRWSVVPDNFFFTHYRAKQDLLRILAYNPLNPPRTVVHLRDADSLASDPRKGLTENAFEALGSLLPPDTYLVTNRVEWYDYFEKNYHWRHPDWQEVVHSAFRKSWGVRGKKFVRQKGKMTNPKLRFNDTRNILQMWADWFAILTADVVYHTHSDFSISAIHWQNVKSKVIGDWNSTTKQLEFFEESWRESGEMVRLVDRRSNVEGTSQLRNCEEDEVAVDDPLPENE